MSVAPESMSSTVSCPIIGNSHASDESESSIDDQNFSMRPEVDAREMNEAENLHCNTSTFHQPDGAPVDGVTSNRILKEMYFHAATRAIRKRFRKGIRNFAFPKKKIFKRDRAFRRTNGAQHCRKDLIPVFQRRNFVPLYQRRSKKVTHGTDESVVADVVVGSDRMSDFLLVREEIPDHEQSS